MAVVIRQRLASWNNISKLRILAQILLHQNLSRWDIYVVLGATTIRSTDATRCIRNLSQSSKSRYRRLSTCIFGGDIDDIRKKVITDDDASSNHTPSFSRRALQSSLQTMMIDNPLEKTIRMGMRNSAFLFGEGHRRLRRRQGRRRRLSSMVSPTIESKKLQMYLACFAIVFAW